MKWHFYIELRYILEYLYVNFLSHIQCILLILYIAVAQLVEISLIHFEKLYKSSLLMLFAPNNNAGFYMHSITSRLYSILHKILEIVSFFTVFFDF